MDEELKSALGKIEPPAASEAARERALAAAMTAFDAAQDKKTANVQGKGFGARLISIVSVMKGKWTMDMRVPLGATVAALLVLPLGVALMNQTTLSPLETVVQQPATREIQTERAEPTQSQELADAASVASPPAPAPMPTMVPAPAPMATRQSAGVPMMESFIGVGAAGMEMPADRFAAFEEGGVQIVAENPVSTFSIDVDTASYSYVRRMLEMGQLPPPDAVRVEEMINYFDYDYTAPQGDAPFAPSVMVTESPWNAENRLVHIGIEGQAVALDAVPPANLVLLIDTSGSMEAPDKLPLLKRAFALLVGEMGPDDTISIVTYAGSAGVVLEPTKGSEKAEILEALETLSPGGSTAGAEGIEAAYRLAEKAMIEGGTNRVLLATDGDFNVGIADPNGLERLIEARRDEGIFLSVLGFGTGNYNDQTMQTLAQAGNGNAAYIDSYSEARRVLVEEMGGTLLTIAKDVKIQVEFNPATVSEYRLIGYETRALAREDFNNDAVDAGDIGAGHSVTAIYEITPVGARGAVDPLRYGDGAAPAGDGEEYGYLKIRYKAPDSEMSELIETVIAVGDGSLAEAGEDIRFSTAVAAFGQKLRGSDWLRSYDWVEIEALAASGRGDDPTGRRGELVRLVGIAGELAE